MKRTISVIAAVIFTVSITTAQTVADAIKALDYGKNKTAKEQLQKIVAANDKDASAIYWLGQSMIVVDDVAGAKAVYQKALSAGVNEPLIWIGMAHIDLLEGADWNAASQKFEQAITFSTETKGKNKGKPSVVVLNAIGRANTIGHSVTNGGSKFGNPEYAIEKLKQAATIDLTNTECFIYMGLCYRKLGGEFGGEAQKAYTEALSRNSNNPLANYLTGKIYLSQQNKPFMEQYFNAALANDVAFAPVYLDYYNYYSNRDVNIAKDNIEKYLQYSDKDCNNDYFYADYLFRAGKYQESINKAKELENSDCKTRVAILYAYNYDKLNDSIQAKTNIDKFFAATTADKVLITDYDIAVKVLSRFPGMEVQAISYLDKAFDLETSKNGQLQYLSQKIDILGKAKLYAEQIKAIEKGIELKGTTSELDYYRLSNAAFQGKDYVYGLDIARKYLAAFPDKPQGYEFVVKSAKKVDSTNSTGLLFEAVTKQNEFIIKDTAKYKQKLIDNYYVQLGYYNDVLKDNSKAIEVCDQILFLVPNEPQTLKIRESLKKNSDKKGNNESSPKSSKPTSGNKPTGAIHQQRITNKV